MQHWHSRLIRLVLELSHSQQSSSLDTHTQKLARENNKRNKNQLWTLVIAVANTRFLITAHQPASLFANCCNTYRHSNILMNTVKQWERQFFFAKVLKKRDKYFLGLSSFKNVAIFKVTFVGKLKLWPDLKIVKVTPYWKWIYGTLEIEEQEKVHHLLFMWHFSVTSNFMMYNPTVVKLTKHEMVNWKAAHSRTSLII